MASAPTGVNAPENSAITTCPELPGDDLYAHAATQHLEQLDAFLTGKELLVVAQGGDSDAVRQIVDFDLSEIPELPPEHPQHERRHETRIKNRMQNSVNEMKRGFERCPQDPSVYSVSVDTDGSEGKVNNTLYVDDGRLAWDHDEAPIAKAQDTKEKLHDRYGIEFI